MNATPGVATALRSSARISVDDRVGGRRQQRVDVGDQQHAAAVAHRRHRRRDCLEPVLGAQRTHFRPVQFDQPPVGADRTHQGGLADARGPRNQHAEIRFGAQGLQQLRLVERELEPFGEAAGLRVACP